MESVAIDRAGMSHVPVNSLKGHYGHTMGAAGVLETVLTMAALDEGIILGTRGFESLGVSHPVNVSAQNRTTDKHAFVKLLSGFGGCNAAMLFRKGGEL
jgi:3-oxoacyl-[acyl-carrier-protein] synthase-1